MLRRVAGLTAVILLVLVLVPLTATPAAAVPASSWVVSWASAMAWRVPGVADNATVRQLVPLSVGGTSVRVQLSNQFGTTPMTVGAATLAVDLKGPAVVAGTVRALSFGGRPSVVIPPGGTVTSDPVAFGVRAGEQLAVSVWVPGQSQVTAHYDAGPMSYAADNGGNLTADTSGAGLVLPETWDRWVASVDVEGTPTTGNATVALGDSISDGFNPACAMDNCQLTNAWPDVLQRRLQQLPAGQRVSVVDESITANTLTVINTPKARQYRTGGGGPPGLVRLGQILSLPGVDRLIVLLGTNDLWFGASAQQVIAGYQQLLSAAAAAHVGVIGVTLLPRAGSKGWTAHMEAERQQVNHWILTSGQFPAVLDLASVVGDVYGGACQPTVMYPPFDSGDHLHPGTPGQTAMADAIPTTLLGAGAAPQVPAVVAAVPTKGCTHPQVVHVNSSFPLTAAQRSAASTTTTTTVEPASATKSAGKGSSPSSRPTALGASGSHLTGASGHVGEEVAAGLAAALVLVMVAATSRGRRRRRRARAAREARRWPVADPSRGAATRELASSRRSDWERRAPR